MDQNKLCPTIDICSGCAKIIRAGNRRAYSGICSHVGCYDCKKILFPKNIEGMFRCYKCKLVTIILVYSNYPMSREKISKKYASNILTFTRQNCVYGLLCNNASCIYNHQSSF